MKRWLRYPAILLTSVVAGLFSLIVGMLLMIHLANRGSLELYDSPEYQSLKEQFADQPDNAQLRQAIRELDYQQRQQYFRSRQFTRTGVYLLIGGILVTLATARWAVTLKQSPPHPAPIDPDLDQEEWQQRWGRWAAASVVGALVLSLGWLAFETRSYLTSAADPSDRLVPQDSSPADAPAPAAVADPTEAARELPSREEYLQQWPRFRGPTGSGIAVQAEAPKSWDVESGEGVRWKTAIPLAGRNSAIVWNQHVFLSGATAEQQTIYCLDADDGQFRWQYDFPPDIGSEEEFEVMEATGYAAPTMATDGVRAYAVFASGDLVAVDFSGNEVWHKRFGIPDNPYGHANSLTTYRNLLIVQFDQGSGRDGKSKLWAFDGATGEVAWEVQREMPSSWASPIVVEHEGNPLLITCASPWVIAYSPTDGREIWRVECLSADVGPSPVYSDGMVFVANETGGLTVIRASGEGDITDENVVWTTDIDVPDTSSPLVTDQFLIMVAYGFMACFDKAGSSDEPLWEEDIVDEVNSSPGLVGKHIYLFSAEGNAWVFEPRQEECIRISEMTMGEPCHASPAFHEGRIYIRGEEHLFCLEDQATGVEEQ